MLPNRFLGFRLAELRYECLMALIGQIFHSYRVPLESRRMLTKKRVLTSALRDMFRFEKKDIATKLADATKVSTRVLTECQLICLDHRTGS